MTAYGDPGDYLNGNELYVLLQVRRLGGRDTTISATDDTPVLRLKLDGYGHKVLDDADGVTNYEKETADTGIIVHREHPIRFRRTPKPTASATAIRMVPYKTSPEYTPPSPLWHYGHPTGLKRGYVWDDDTSAMWVVPDTSLEVIDSLAGYSRYITITRGMLHASGNRVPRTGTYDLTTESDATWPVDAGGACAGPWVTYRGLVTFRTDRRIRIRRPNDTILKVTSNPAFTRNEYRFRGRPHPTAKDLRVTVEYLGHDTVEIDFVEFRTPHAHDVLTDEYRSEMMESIGHFEQQYLQGLTTAGRDTSDFKIMGFRLMEERGEPLWRLYRHMNQLLRGYAFGVMSTQPYDHFRHTLDVDAAPPLANGDRTWYWDYAPSGLANEQTAVPFIRNGQPYLDKNDRALPHPVSSRTRGELNDRTAFGLKYGIEQTWDGRTLWPRPAYAGAPSPSQPWSKSDYINSLSHYELSWGLKMDRVSPNKSHLETFDEMRLIGNIGATGYPTQTDIIKHYLNEEGMTIEYEYRHANADSSWIHGWYDVPLQMRREANLYERLSRPHNRKRFYDGTPWIGHVWLYDNFAARRYDALYSSWFVHSRQGEGGRRRLTAEEFRSDLILPVLLGARSVIVFYGGGGDKGLNPALAELHYERGFRNQRPWPIPTSGGCLSLLDTCQGNKLAPTAANTLELRRALRGDDDDLYFGSDRMTHLDTPLVVVPVIGPADTIVATAAVPHMVLTGSKDTTRAHSLAADRWLLTKGMTKTESGLDILGMYSDNGVQSDSIDRSDEIYVAMRSPRREAVLFGGALLRTIPNPTSWTAGDTTWMDRLAQLRLVGWYGHGYITQTSHDVARYGSNSPLSGLIDLPGIRTRHPYRYFNTQRDFEPRDSAFFDVTVLRRVKPATSGPGLDTVALHNEFYLGVANRRTNPLVIDHADTTEYPYGRWRFVTPYDMTHDTVLRQKPYEQLGSREIDVPLRYAHPDGKPRLIRITEMPLNLLGSFNYDTVDAHGREIEHVVTIDTIIDAMSSFAVRLLPGEGKLFRCVVLPAADEIDDGYLAYSTQNKMVAYPVRRPNGTWSDSIRYHVVFHRNDAPKPAGTGITSVFYARSVPYRRDSLPDVAGLKFAEPPVNISVTTFFNKDSVRYSVGGSVTEFNHRMNYLSEMGTDTMPQSDTCSCAFPSITISPAAVDTAPPRIHVVYVCGDIWTDTVFRPKYAHVVENVFPDLLNQPVPKNNGKSLVVIHRKTGTADSLAGLSTAGMPVVNTAHGRNFYAWTSWGGLLGVGHKQRGDQYFRQTKGVKFVPNANVAIGGSDSSSGTYSGAQPFFPSINVYSNLARMDSTATVVWQTGNHIRYTRLRPIDTSDVDRFLPPFKDMAYANLPGTWVSVNGAHRIAVVSRVTAGDSARMPVVIRSLQADTMRMYVRDTARTPALDTILDYETESIAWEEHLAADDRAVIRTRHFVDVTSAGQHAGAYYWGTVTTYSPSRSLFHPVITQGAVRLDSLTWQGWIGNTLWTFGDSLKVLRGNISDSAVLVCYNTMTLNPFRDLRDHADAHLFSYWSGRSNFGSLMTQQIEVPPLARVPGFPSPITHTRWLKASGAWPHLSARRREDTPDGISSVRRILQYDTLTPPSIFISAEQFYRLGAMPGFTDEPYTPREFVGMEAAAADVTIAAALRRQETGSDNAGDDEDVASRLRFRCVFDTEEVEPATFHDTPWSGNEKLRHLHASMTQRLTSVVSEPFVVHGSPYEEYELVVDVLGTYRDDVHLVLDEVEVDVDAESVDASRNGDQGVEQPRDRGTSVRTRVVRSLDVGLPSVVADNMPQHQRTTSYALTGGEGRLWRLRLTSEPWVRAKPHVELDISPTHNDLERRAIQTLRHIDLRTMSMSHLDANSDIFLMPNPTSSRVRCGLRTSSAAGGTLRLQCVSVTGTIVADLPITTNTFVDIDGLSSGTYSVRVVTNDGQPTLIRPRMLVVVR